MHICSEHSQQRELCLKETLNLKAKCNSKKREMCFYASCIALVEYACCMFQSSVLCVDTRMTNKEQKRIHVDQSHVRDVRVQHSPLPFECVSRVMWISTPQHQCHCLTSKANIITDRMPRRKVGLVQLLACLPVKQLRQGICRQRAPLGPQTRCWWAFPEVGQCSYKAGSEGRS